MSDEGDYPSSQHLRGRDAFEKLYEQSFQRVNKSSSIVNKSSATHSTASQCSSRDESSYQQTESSHLSDERGHPTYDINDTERIAVQNIGNQESTSTAVPPMANYTLPSNERTLFNVGSDQEGFPDYAGSSDPGIEFPKIDYDSMADSFENIGNDDSTYTAEPPMADHTHTLPSPYPRVNKSSSIVNKSSATHSTTSQGSSRDGSSYQQTESRHLVANPQNTDSHAEQNRELQVQSSMGYKYLNQQFSNDEAVPARGDFTRTPMVAAPFESLKSKITASETPNTDEQYLQDVVEPTPLVLSAPLNDPSTSTTRLPAFNVISNRSSYQQTGSHTPFPIQHSVPLAFQNHPVPTSNSQVGDPRETSDPDSDFGEEPQSVYHPFSINDNSSTIHWLPTRIHVSSLRNTVSPTNRNQPIPTSNFQIGHPMKTSDPNNAAESSFSQTTQTQPVRGLRFYELLTRQSTSGDGTSGGSSPKTPDGTEPSELDPSILSFRLNSLPPDDEE